MEESKKDVAISFLKLASVGQVRDAFSKFVGAGFRHHNPYFEGSAQPLMKAMGENTRQNPNKILDVERTITQGDFEVAPSQLKQRPDDFGEAVVLIFSFEKDRIVELWDVGQAVPERSPNQYGMFWMEA